MYFYTGMIVRLQKYLAQRGVGSRRKCEQYISKGLIKVNGKIVTEMGIKIDPASDAVETAPKLKFEEQKLVYFAFHKPVGYITAVAGKEKPKIIELLSKIPQRVFPVGRLDKLTSGLLILTNDGRLAYKLIHPKFEKEKEYIVKISEKITPKIVDRLSESFYVRGKKTMPARLFQLSPHLLKIILKEGRNRQIRRMCKRALLRIEKLKRIRIGNIHLGDLKPGAYRPLTKEELKGLI